MKIADRVRALAAPVVEGLGCTLWDAEYVREGGEWFLRLYIDKDGGVGIDDCEAVSRAFDPILDEEDPIPESYRFEVSSAGLERPLRRPEHFAWAKGRRVAVRLYRPRDGAKEFAGTLSGFDGAALTLETPVGPVSLDKKEVALARLDMEV